MCIACLALLRSPALSALRFSYSASQCDSLKRRDRDREREKEEEEKEREREKGALSM